MRKLPRTWMASGTGGRIGSIRSCSDAYDRTGREPYAGVADFIAMCSACFGVAPSLTHRLDADTWHDVDGSRVLEPWFK